jgi:hypothetical protein
MWQQYYSKLLKQVIMLYNINCVEFADEKFINTRK